MKIVAQYCQSLDWPPKPYMEDTPKKKKHVDFCESFISFTPFYIGDDEKKEVPEDYKPR